jgi:hypothetical protein
MKTMLESMDKGKAKNKSPIIEKRLKGKRHGLGACKKTLRKAMRKQKKKKWKLSTDTTKELMSSPKCRSVEVINNPTRPGSNHREVTV